MLLRRGNPDSFSEEQLLRYGRHFVLDTIGRKGQKKLLDAKVLVIGAGGLGSPVTLYLAAAGVGTIGIVDNDTVSATDLQRQVLHNIANIGKNKTDSAHKAIVELTPDTTVINHKLYLNSNNITDIIENYDIIADCTDNFPTRFLLNDACFFMQKPLVYASVLKMEGQLTTLRAYEDNAPCIRCAFGNAPPPDLIPNSSEVGILGSAAGVIGTLQATEIIKEILGIGESLCGFLLTYNGLNADFKKINFHKDTGCALCGDTPSITSIS